MTPLEQWLSIATRGLSAESAARVRDEIQQHYDSACEAGEESIAALGNPRAANRAYRRVLLTEHEATMAATLTNPKRPALLRLAVLSAVVFAFSSSMSRRIPGYWIMVFALYSGMLLNWLYPPITLRRSRIYGYLLALRCTIVAAIGGWYYGWVWTLGFCSIFFLIDGFFQRTRLSIFRKLGAGQTYSLLPGEPQLTHLEAITLRTLSRKDPYENVAGSMVLLMVIAMAIWQPATFAPLAVWVVAADITRRTIPFRTEQSSRRFRIVKWTAMAIAALLPFAYRARGPWGGALMLALLFVLFDFRSISLRRKVPIGQWPEKLYW